MPNAKANYNLPILDLYLASFLQLKGFSPILVKQGGRVTFFFPSIEEIYSLCKAYNSNLPVPVVDFVSSVRQLRPQMITLKRLNG